jgi:hypothetical protein
MAVIRGVEGKRLMYRATSLGALMPDDRADDNWQVVASDLRDTLARSGVSETVAERVLASIARPVAAIECERGSVEPELMWALIVTAADSYRRVRS